MTEEQSDEILVLFRRLIAQIEQERSEWLMVRARAEEQVSDISQQLAEMRRALARYKRRQGK